MSRRPIGLCGSGRGSSYNRADKIQWIYEDAAPPINSAMSESARTFLHKLHEIVRQAVEEAGGQFRTGLSTAERQSHDAPP